MLAIYEIRTFLPFKRTVIPRYLKLYEMVFEFLPSSKLYTVYFKELNADILPIHSRNTAKFRKKKKHRKRFTTVSSTFTFTLA